MKAVLPALAAQLLSAAAIAAVPSDPPPSWNDGAGGGGRFCLFGHHTDAKREWACDRGSRIGGLDKGLDEARARGWTVVSMKDDWKRIYPDAP